MLLISCAVALAAAQAFAAEAVIRAPTIRAKGRLVAFDGTVMRVEPLPSKNGKGADSYNVEVTPQTRYVGSTRTSFGAIKLGDYVGAAVTEQRNGSLRAQDVFLYAETLRGTGEGRFPEADRLVVNGTVTAIKPSSPDDTQDGTFTVHYRGAVLTGARSRSICEGRAVPPAYTSPLACQADVTIEVLPNTPVSSLMPGSKDLLQPGALVTVAMTKDGDRTIGLGVVVEPGSGIGVEKPQSSP